ncbi:MAG: polysaccharide deacetylase family protein [Gammaproteobacteria bacterium]|nr:polysaccharide deacetylase family protein [Gammaproteobacteria bacterium]
MMFAKLAAWSMRRPLHHTLIFHRVLADRDPMSPGEPTAAWFDDLIAMLARNFELLALSEAVRRAADGTLRAGSVSITFDDGYADNATIAAPVLRKHSAPATFFVASGYLDGGRMWNDTIIETFRRLDPGTHEIDAEAGLTFTLGDWASRRQAAGDTIKAWKHLPPAQRRANVEALATRVGGLPDDLMMTTEQLRGLDAQRGVTIGGHTRTHPILAAIDDDEARGEIEGGKADLESVLQHDIELFAYPNGKAGADYTAGHADLVRRAGFAAAVATDWGTLSTATDRYRIPRFTPWHTNLARFSIDLARCHYGQL